MEHIFYIIRTNSFIINSGNTETVALRYSAKRCSWAFRKTHRKIPVQEKTCVSLCFTLCFLKRLRHRCFPMNFAKFARTLFLQNTSGRLFLELEVVISLCLDGRTLNYIVSSPNFTTNIKWIWANLSELINSYSPWIINSLDIWIKILQKSLS